MPPKVSIDPRSQAASVLGRRSAEVRTELWGRREFVKRMREWGKMGGRPKGSGKATKKAKKGATE
jgi:hypothetical protein